MITSLIPGRLRIRDVRFKDTDTCNELAQLLTGHPSVSKVTANPVTGSLLIEYDPEKLDLEEARQALAAIAPEGEDWLADYEESLAPATDWNPQALAQAFNPWPGGANKDGIEYLAMTGAFIICTSSAFLRSKGLHIYSGLTLAGLTVQHIYKYRKRLLNNLKPFFAPEEP